jgi:hypothetical protein
MSASSSHGTSSSLSCEICARIFGHLGWMWLSEPHSKYLWGPEFAFFLHLTFCKGLVKWGDRSAKSPPRSSSSCSWVSEEREDKVCLCWNETQLNRQSVLGVSRRLQGNGPKRAHPREVETFARLPRHDPRNRKALIMDEGCSEELSSVSLPSSLDRYEFCHGLWSVLRVRVLTDVVNDGDTRV